MYIKSLLFVILALWSSFSFATSSAVWLQQSQADFEKGTSENVSITSDNKVVLSPSFSLISEVSEIYLWSLTSDSKGNLYAGSGNKGIIFKLSKDKKLVEFYKTNELEIHSIAVDKGDNIYAGSSPDGAIYKISPDGKGTIFFDVPEKYIWSLVFDNAGNLYAGTGDSGKIYKISPDGKGSVLYDSKETHIMSLAFNKGYLYAGSEGNGIVYKIDIAKKDVMVIYDTQQREIRSLVVDSQDNLYVASTSGKVEVKQTDESDTEGSQSSNTESSSRPSQSSSSESANKGESVLYKISPDGVITNLWDTPEALLLSIFTDNSGNIIAGTGNRGIIYKITPNGEVTKLIKCDEYQILSFALSTNGIYFTTGNLGKLYLLTQDYVQSGTLESKPFDASTISKWGKISWDGNFPKGTNITLSTRSGNTDKPDDTWSDWSTEYQISDGSQITSPPARFIQWKAKLSSSDKKATPILNKVSVAYLQGNMKPFITSLSVSSSTAGNVPSKKNSKSSGQSQTDSPQQGQRGIISIKWKAQDPNNDKLSYKLYFKGVDENNWILLKEDLTGTSYNWDTESVPDGSYLVKLVVSDSPDNPDDQFLSDYKISESFNVDNTPPIVKDLKYVISSDKRCTVTGVGVDAYSPLKIGEYSIDSGDWKSFFPSDGIFDSKSESFSFTIDSLSPTEHIIVVRIVDFENNVGTGKIVVRF